MNIIPTLITVRGDEQIERAIASEITTDHEITVGFLEEVSKAYAYSPKKEDEEEKD